MLVCSECKSDNIQIKMWVNPNTNAIKDNVSDGETDDNWCENCQSHTKFKFKRKKKTLLKK